MIYDVLVIGGGQTGLSCGYYLRRAGLSFLILDAGESAGGAWQKSWQSLHLFSPSEFSSLPGWRMPRGAGYYPTRDEVVAYLQEYEARYELPVKRPVNVERVTVANGIFTVHSGESDYQSRAVISSTGRWSAQFIPNIPGRDLFRGRQMHAVHYRSADDFRGQQIAIVGEGNSGAQILSEVSIVAETKWAVKHEPIFLPDDVDGRVLFFQASARYAAALEGKPVTTPHNLRSIVMVPEVREARDRGVLKPRGTIECVDVDGIQWTDGTHDDVDAIIWCTGFGYAIEHLAPLGVIEQNGHVLTHETRSLKQPGLWLVGYGNWTGYASATLIGVGRTAKQTVQEIAQYLENGRLESEAHQTRIQSS